MDGNGEDRELANIEDPVFSQNSDAADEEGTQSLARPVAETVAGPDPDVLSAAVEAALAPEFEALEELGKEGLDAAETAAGTLTGYFRKFAAETANYSEESWDTGSAFAARLLRAKTLPDAVHIQVDFTKSAYLRLLEHLANMSGLYWALAGQAIKPSKNAAAALEG